MELMEKVIETSIGKRDLIKYIEEHPEINYIANVVTPYTFLCARAVLNYIHEELGVEKTNGVFIVKPWQPDKWAIQKELPVSNDYNTSIWMKVKNENDSRVKNLLEVVRLSKGKHSDNKRTVYVIHIDGVWDSFAVYAKAYSDIEFVHLYLDEPREPYYNFIEWLHIMRGRLSYFPAFIKDKIRKGIIQKIILSRAGVKITTLNTFDKKTFFSEKYIKYMKTVLEEEGAAYDFCPDGKYVLYLSNAYDEETHKKITSIAEETLSKFAKEGYKIFVKQHPREKVPLNFTSFEAFYIPNHYAVESFIASVSNKPSFVIGAETTVMAKISVFWSIPCYCLLDHPLLCKDKKYEWNKWYDNCAMRCISCFKYSKEMGK